MVTDINTLFTGKVLISLEAVNSTNSYLKEVVSKSRPIEGTVVTAHHQTAGRGQLGNEWLSAPGENLTISLLYYPVFLAAEAHFRLNQAISLGVCETVQQLAGKVEVRIKWPNDIYAGSRKIAGLLIENSLSGAFISDSIIGIGLNVNQRKFQEQAGRATSLSLLAGDNLDVGNVLAVLCARIEHRYLQLKKGDHRQLNEDYTRVLYQRDEVKRYKTADGVLEGKILGVNPTGQLILQSAGKQQLYSNKEIEYLAG